MKARYVAKAPSGSKAQEEAEKQGASFGVHRGILKGNAALVKCKNDTELLPKKRSG